MRDPERISTTLAELERFWRDHPDWRLCQVIVNAARHAGWPSDDPFHLEDDRFLDGLRDMAQHV